MFGPRSAGSTLVYLLGEASGTLSAGFTQVRGGPGALTHAMAQAAQTAGATIRTGTPVERVIVEGERVAASSLAESRSALRRSSRRSTRSRHFSDSSIPRSVARLSLEDSQLPRKRHRRKSQSRAFGVAHLQRQVRQAGHDSASTARNFCPDGSTSVLTSTISSGRSITPSTARCRTSPGSTSASRPSWIRRSGRAADM